MQSQLGQTGPDAVPLISYLLGGKANGYARRASTSRNTGTSPPMWDSCGTPASTRRW